MIMLVRPAITLKEKAIQKLMFEPAVNSSKINVSCKKNKVILTGSVKSLFEKNVAQRAIQGIKGAQEVVNKLQVDVSDKHKQIDTDIANAVINALKWDVSIPENVIQVRVKNGEVTLSGNVDWWYQKINAEKAIRNFKGVKNINNQINIHPIVTAKGVRKKIMEEFHRNASIDVEKIHIEIDGNKVILKGSVNSWPEMKEAIRAAWSIPGITQLDNQLIINTHNF